MDEVAELFYATTALEFAKAFDPVPVLQMRGGPIRLLRLEEADWEPSCSAHRPPDPNCTVCSLAFLASLMSAPGRRIRK